MDILIVDDEAPARSRLNMLLADIGGPWNVVAEAANGPDAISQYQAHTPDIILLDISLPGCDGLEVARQLCSETKAPAVIFCTAYDEHAVEAFRLEARDYLMKPVRTEQLKEALERAQRSLETAEPKEEGPQHLVARYRGERRRIPVTDVIYLQSDQKYTAIHHQNGVDLVEDSLKQLENLLGDRFLRIHRNALVAKDCIRGIIQEDGRWLIRLRDSNRSLEVSRRHLATVKQLLN